MGRKIKNNLNVPFIVYTINQTKRSTHYCLSEPPQHCGHKQRKLKNLNV